MKSENLSKLFEAIYNEARSTNLWYIGIRSGNSWIFKHDENGHVVSFKDRNDLNKELEKLRKNHPNKEFQVFDENDPEVLAATKDTAIVA